MVARGRRLPYDRGMARPRTELLSTLAWLVDAGADEAVADQPTDRFSSPAPKAAPARIEETRPGFPESPHAPVSRAQVRTTPSVHAAPPPASGDTIGAAMEIAARCQSLAELKAALESFEGSSLKKQATHTVFADGTPSHHIMFIGEAPGRDEDIAGLPFVGRAGKLLDKMLAAIHLDRKTNVYITNVLNWRPPDNRDPSPEEAATSLPFLRRHIELAAPEIIVLLGAVAARHVMGKTDGIMRLRGKWLEYHVGGRMVPVMPTLHPAYLLRRAVDKKLAWRDLQAIEDRIKSLGLLEPAASRG
jgi:uracil-DNA glycosylase